MNASTPRIRLLAVAVAGIVVAGAGLSLALIRPWSNDSYAPAPFAKVPDDYPRILPIEDRPRASDKAALDRYLAARRKVWSYLRDEGAIQRATPEEREAVTLIRNEKYVRGWEAAVEVLRANRESAPGWYALADAEYYGEKNLPRALHAVRKARRILEGRGQADPNDADSREWYLFVLDLEYRILQGLERFEEALRVVDLLEQTYQPMPWLKIWPLFKLDRLAEAEAAIAAAEATGAWPIRVLNNRLVLEELHRRRGAPYAVGQQIVALQSNSPVIWSNLGETALEDFRIDEAEKAFRKSVEIGRPDFFGTAYTHLTRLYVQQGRFREAINARRQAQVHRASREPHTLQFDQGRVDRSTALLLLAAGQPADAERFARRMHAIPDRLGSITTRPDDQSLSNDLLLATVLSNRMEEERELARTEGSRWKRAANRVLAAAELWDLQHRIRRVIVASGRLNDLRPYAPDGAPIETWMLGDLMRLMPADVALAMVRQARTEEEKAANAQGSTEILQRVSPYFDALQAEAALFAGKPGDALELAQRALEQLPDPGEKLLRGRTAAVAGEAARQLGNRDEAMRWFRQALADGPIAFRLLKLAIPVRITDDGSPLAQAVAQRLGRSPRLRHDAAGFPVEIRVDGNQLTFRITRNETVHCAGQLPQPGGSDDAVTAAVAAIHQHLMCPQVRLSAIEINALDDSPAAIKARADQKAILDIARPKK